MLQMLIHLRFLSLTHHTPDTEKEGDMQQDRHHDDDDPEGIVQQELHGMRRCLTHQLIQRAAVNAACLTAIFFHRDVHARV